MLVPEFGIYAGAVGEKRAAISIGVNPHYGGAERRIEAYLLDFEGDLYGKNLRIAFVERLRPELAFDDVDALVTQMHRDVEDARRICADFTEAAARGG
jgi:riboflavin kinase/FMN adenylyltransferase